MISPFLPEHGRSAARQISVSPRTLYNVIARGEGPALTRVSERRVIIEDDVWADWLKTRRQHPPRRPAPEENEASA
jgi:hypothetical protein